ncbi:MAG TPA: ATP-binding protein [Polyangiaceae bacterium]|nr:ATP-binding protein [Polyangiaceae bacterium]
MRSDGKTRSLASQVADERALRVQAEEANRIKDEFLGTLSHELRTPLNAITGWAHLLQAGTLGPDEQLRAVDTILRNAKQQARLIEDLLDVSRIISGKLSLTLSPLDLKKVVETAIEAATPAALAKQLSVTTEFAAGSSEVSGDAVRLQQVLANLLNNSIKFCETGGQIVIRLQPRDQRVELKVSDDGRGIAAEFVPLLFERFRQAGHPLARARGSGLGLGLAIARYLVEAHRGTITAESAGEGRGATFSVCLPLLSATDSQLPTLESAPPASRQLCGAYILVVDDDQDARELLRMLLEREGAEVALAASPSAARDLIRARQPDVIVCDVGMPEQDGYSFMRHLRASGERAGAFVPAIALTGHASAEDSRLALLAGFQMHTSKPLDPPRLLENLAKLWRRGVTRIP